MLFRTKLELKDASEKFCYVVDNDSSDNESESRAIPFAGNIHNAARNILLDKMIKRKSIHKEELELIVDD